jgi:hypothetical protein
VVADLRAQPGVRGAERTDFAVTFLVGAGLNGLATFPPPGTKAAAGSPSSDPTCRNAMFLSPFWFEFAREDPQRYYVGRIEQRLRAASCRDHYFIDSTRSVDEPSGLFAITPADFKRASAFDVVYLDTHGQAIKLYLDGELIRQTEVFFDVLADCGDGPKAVCPPLPEELTRYLDALHEAGELAHLPQKLNVELDETKPPHGSMAAAFLANGSAAYIGWTHVISRGSAARVMNELFDCLLEHDTVAFCYAKARANPPRGQARLRFQQLGPDFAICERP